MLLLFENNSLSPFKLQYSLLCVAEYEQNNDHFKLVNRSTIHASMPIIETFLVTFSSQKTPLHVAASNGRDYTVKCLVKKEADINIKDKTGVNETVLLMIVC